MTGLTTVLWGVAVALLPSPLKIVIYRSLYGFQIGRGVRIGLSPFVRVQRCRIGDGVRVGHGNIFIEIGDLEIGNKTRIGFLNVFRGGLRIRIGEFCTIMRRNTLNSIIERDFSDPVEASLTIGTGTVITASHWIDFSAGIAIDDHVIVGGRNSSFWTHNRRRGRGIVVGAHTYFGSEVRLAPGVEVGSFNIVALGSVLTGQYARSRTLIGGNPATVIRELNEGDLALVVHKTRGDIPDQVVAASLPDDLKALGTKALRRESPTEPGIRPCTEGENRQCVG